MRVTKDTTLVSLQATKVSTRSLSSAELSQVETVLDTVLAETGNQVYAKCLIEGAV